MKTLLPLVKSYIKNSFSVIEDLRDLHLPPEVKLFSADATLMYTNIDTLTGVTSIKHFLSDNRDNLPDNFPTKLFLHILHIVMENNVFYFDNTYWLQLAEAAMGTPAACAYATISYGQHKIAVILPTFSSNLLYFKWYIDDIFGIWLPPSNNKLATWEAFKACINNWGSLTWVIEEPSTTTNFLDLTLTITDSRISTATFQKPIYLYLYIPPTSAHPPSCFKGLIVGELRRYWLQNDAHNFKEILSKVIIRLIDRGHKIVHLAPLLLKAAETLDNKQTCPLNENDNTLYIHWGYQPHGLHRAVIRKIYNDTLSQSLDYDKMQVDISRPRNLRDALTCTELSLPNALNLNKIIEQLHSQQLNDNNN
jgi:hypothetical protein